MQPNSKFLCIYQTTDRCRFGWLEFYRGRLCLKTMQNCEDMRRYSWQIVHSDLALEP